MDEKKINERERIKEAHAKRNCTISTQRENVWMYKQKKNTTLDFKANWDQLAPKSISVRCWLAISMQKQLARTHHQQAVHDTILTHINLDETS